MDLEESPFGIIDEPNETKFLRAQKNTYSSLKPFGSDPYLKEFNHTDALYYWNII